MSPLIALGLLLQVMALALLWAKIGRSWPHYLGAIFILMAVIYHGVSEVLIAIFPNQNSYRPLFNPQYLAQFVLLVSVAILIFSITYVCTVGPRPELLVPPDEVGASLTKRIFDYRILLIVTGPLLLLTLNGQGYATNGAINPGGGVGTTLGLTQQFFILGVVLSGFAFLVRFGQRWMFTVLMIQSLILSLVGERLAILTGALMLLFALNRFSVKIRRRHVAFAFLMLFLFGWAITAARGVEGRYESSSGASVRLTFLTVGFTHLFSSTTWGEIEYTLSYRLDGNSYGAMSLQALENGSTPVGSKPLINDMLLAIPSFINPSKDQANPIERSEKLYVEENLPIPELYQAPGIYIDILPTQLGGLTGILGPLGMLCAALALGLGFAALDRRLRYGLGPGRTLVSLGFFYCLFNYEGSWDTYTITARGILLLLAIMLPLLAIRRSVRRGDQRPGVDGRPLGVGYQQRVVLAGKVYKGRENDYDTPG
jgi:hypothetical protein